MTLAGFFLLTDLILLLRRILKCCYALNPFFLIPITYQLITKKLLKNQSSVIRSLDIVNLKVKKTIYILKCASYTYSYKTENCQSIFTYNQNFYLSPQLDASTTSNHHQFQHH